MDIRKIEYCLFSKWNHTISNQDAQKEMRQLLSRRKPLRLYHDLQRRLRTGGDKNIPNDTFIITCALFCRAQENGEEISASLRECGMEEMLYKGFLLFLHNKSKSRKFTISWTDRHFPNKYMWLSRFAGQFRDFAHWELLSVANLLYEFDRDKLWQIAKDDPNDLILLNWCEILGEFPSDDRALELLVPGQSARRHALAFWWLTFSVHSLPEGETQACSVLLRLEDVSEHILFTCIYEFALTRDFLPQTFLEYLIKPSRDTLLRTELMRTDLISDWRQALVLSEIINNITSLRRQDFYWKSLLECIAEKVKAGKLICNTDTGKAFLASLPGRYLKALQESLSTWSKTLHTQTIDSIVRPEIYRHDILVNNEIQSILRYLGESELSRSVD